MPRSISHCPSCGKDLDKEVPVTSIIFDGQIVSKGSRPNETSLCHLYHEDA